jgi:hypothetical protein
MSPIPNDLGSVYAYGDELATHALIRRDAASVLTPNDTQKYAARSHPRDAWSFAWAAGVKLTGWLQGDAHCGRVLCGGDRDL